ncbi:glycosyl hydrolase 38 protein [Calothrix sp. PCC 7716]|mgnify:FL=1|nr:glycosyl hydrolase 38 protein [Calothrix sp. PCC 7716]
MTPQNPAIDTKLIITAIENLRALCQTEVQAAWRYSLLDLTANQVFQEDISKWDGAITNNKGHVAWESGRRILWLAQKITVPECLVPSYSLQGKSLRLALVWWAEDVQVYVNGKLVAAGDLFDFSPRVLLSEAVTPGDDFIVALRLVSPLHDSGALMRSHLVFDSGTADDPGFVASEIAVVKQYLETFAPDRLSVLAEVVEEFYHRDTEFTEKKVLKAPLIKGGWGDLKSKTIHLLGHAHLDMAWLWQVEETWRAAQNTFESVLKLQQDFPDLVFCHSTPALYAWVEENRPDLFAQIQFQVKAEKWEVLGGFWVEPDLNLISGESIVRQLLYGQRYTQEKFGKISSIVWVPDTFGFCWTLPQFMVSAGIEYFVTQKLRWNDTTKFQKGAFLWRSPDGSEIFSYMSGLIGEGIDPEKMVAYSCEWETQTGIKDALWLPGVGDHGGGPTRDMLEIAQRWQKSEVFPKLEFTTAENYLRHIQNKCRDAINRVSTWNDELYLEFHRGCYTTHADQKRFNRKCEILLYEAEIFAAWANIRCGVKYPKTELEAAWKKLLFNQFHDILPGSSITEVYTDALPEWQEVERVGTEILHKSLHEIALQAPLPTPPHKDFLPIFVFNSLNWSRSEVVCVDLPESFSFACVYSSEGIIPSQSNSSKLLFLAENIPSLGYSIFWLCPSASKNTITLESQTFSLENEYLRVVVNENTGDLDSIYDLVNQKEILDGAGNQLQSWKDSGQYWDGWNIDPNYAQHPLPATQLKSIEWLDRGVIQSRLRVVRTIGNSEFCQDYILDKGSRYLKIATHVNWQERHVLVKAAFPLNIESDFATYEIPCGAIQRTTKPQTPEEKAKWEVPALKWADLTTSNSYGVSLLNDCKYGYDATPNQLRLTLLRGSEWPDSEADKGMHEFTYAVYPHSGSWEEAQTVQKGYELNTPLQVVMRENVKSNSKSTQDSASFLNLGSENLILMAFKQAEDSDAWILRCYECNGKETQIKAQSDFGIVLEAPVDLLERPLQSTESSIKPWKIKTYKVRFSK